MTDKYIQMTEDLQYNKRELQNWKQKQLLTQRNSQNTQKNSTLSKLKTKT